MRSFPVLSVCPTVRLAVFGQVSSELAEGSLRSSAEGRRAGSEEDTTVEGDTDSLTVVDRFDLSILDILLEFLLLLIHLLADERTCSTTDDTTDSSTDSRITCDTTDTSTDQSTCTCADTSSLNCIACTTT